MSKYFAYLIFLTFLTLQATGQDTIYFRNKKSLPINFRIVELKNGLIKVPVTENNNLLIYNYLPNDIDYIISYDTNYVKYLQKKDYDVYYFMAYRKDTSLIFYADHVEPNKEDVSKKILFKEKADSLARVEKRLIKKIKSVKQDSIYAGNVFSFKWAIEARNVIKYKSSRTDETVYYRYNSSTEYNSEKQISLSFLNLELAAVKSDRYRNFHKFSVLGLKYNEYESQRRITGEYQSLVTSGSKNTNFNISIGYTFEYLFLKNKSKRFYPALGMELNPYLNYLRTTPMITRSKYSLTENSIGLNINLVPGLYYFASKNIYFQVSLPLTLFNHNHLITSRNNPNIPPEYRTLSSDYSKLFPYLNTINFRFALGIILK